MLTPIQFLDDIADWRDDLENGSYTVLLSRALSHRGLALTAGLEIPLSERKTLSLMIESGALSTTLMDIQRCLREALRLAETPENSGFFATPTGSYYLDLAAHVDRLVDILRHAEARLACSDTVEREFIIGDIEDDIKIVAQTS